MTSVHRTFVGWLKGAAYKLAKYAMERLGKSQVHSQSGRDFDDGWICGVGMQGSQGYANSSIADPVFRENVDKYNARLVVANFARGPSKVDYLGRFNNHFTAHNHPLLAEMNTRSAGVSKESSEDEA